MEWPSLSQCVSSQNTFSQPQYRLSLLHKSDATTSATKVPKLKLWVCDTSSARRFAQCYDNTHCLQGMNIIRHLWFRWKSLQLPWRKKRLVGYDLAGNSFWEFRDVNNAGRLRRIMQHSKLAHYADIQISPQWHQWLRYTREEAPSIQELRRDVARQIRLKELAAAADARWAAQKSLRDSPKVQQPVPAIGVNDAGGYAGPTETTAKQGVRNSVGSPKDVAKDNVGGMAGEPMKESAREAKELPWKSMVTGSGGEWQPEPWKPGRRRKKKVT